MKTSVHSVLAGIEAPMLAGTDAVEIETLAGTHLFDEKLDGIRALAAWDGTLTLHNRSGRLMDNYPDLEVAAARDLNGPLILDGEIVAVTGKFQDIASRNQRTRTHAIRAMMSCPARFVAFDILWHPERGDVRHLDYINRRALLESLHLRSDQWDTSTVSADPNFYTTIRAQGGEGVIAKRLTSLYGSGRGKAWTKFKSKHRVTCIGTGYEPGSGSRIAFGALFLSVVGSGKVVNVGKVGSGLTHAQTIELKTTLDSAKSIADLPIVEIECLGVTRDGKLRQPVFIGYRTDIVITEVSADQLLSLPVT